MFEYTNVYLFKVTFFLAFWQKKYVEYYGRA